MGSPERTDDTIPHTPAVRTGSRVPGADRDGYVTLYETKSASASRAVRCRRDGVDGRWVMYTVECTDRRRKINRAWRDAHFIREGGCDCIKKYLWRTTTHKALVTTPVGAPWPSRRDAHAALRIKDVPLV